MNILKHFLLAGMAFAAVGIGNTCHARGSCDPIVMDLGHDGFNLGARGIGVRFDVDANGIRDSVQWLRPGGDEGFLALDRTGNGLVDDGAELFGVGTPLLLEGRPAPNGFVGLAQYDALQLGGNDDGLITEADAIWPQLRIWSDVNADGVSTYDEMRTLRSFGITALGTIPKRRKYMDPAGNLIPYWAWAMQRGKPGRFEMVDVFFRQLSN
jgi:hypothetical protein